LRNVTNFSFNWLIFSFNLVYLFCMWICWLLYHKIRNQVYNNFSSRYERSYNRTYSYVPLRMHVLIFLNNSFSFLFIVSSQRIITHSSIFRIFWFLLLRTTRQWRWPKNLGNHETSRVKWFLRLPTSSTTTFNECQRPRTAKKTRYCFVYYTVFTFLSRCTNDVIPSQLCRFRGVGLPADGSSIHCTQRTDWYNRPVISSSADTLTVHCNFPWSIVFCVLCVCVHSRQSLNCW